MARDFWLTRRLAPTVDKIRQTVTLDAVTTNCGPARGSLYVTEDASTVPTNSVAFPITATDGFTIDFYAKVLPSEDFIILIADSAIFRSAHITIVNSNELSISATNSGGSVTESVFCTFLDEWHRYTLSYDASTRKLKFYLDNVLLKTTAAAAVGTLLFPNDAKVYLGSGADTFVNGYYNELRVWNEVLSQDRINDTISYRSTNDTNLSYYVRLRDVSNVPIVGSGVFATISTTAAASTTEFPTLRYGASFVTAIWTVDAVNNISLVWPVDPPDGTTGMLVARWQDDDDVTQRRRLWDLDGVDIAPFPDLYDGENIGSDVTLELWNIDGNDTCVLADELVISISYTTQPTTSYDRVQQAVGTPTLDTTLAAEYPLVFPITFDTQQTY